jgi:DNA helicase-2/ATP-dependent DNA helicase PcrA
MDAKAFPPSVISSFISRVKEKFFSPLELSSNLSHFPNIYREIKLDKIYEEYQSRLHSQNMMDFDDLLFFTTRILSENEYILEQYKEKFKYILIDEYQDINALQSRWFRLLAGSNQNICVVGDDDQSIYGWRGADVSIILSFAKEFKNAHIIKLEQNYRSTQNIISVAEKIISNNKNRLGKNLFTNEIDGEKVEITCYSDSKIEARETVSRIENLKKRESRNFTDFAILVRASSQTRILEEAFIALSVPYKIIGGLKFYERREIKDILSYIKVINNTADDIAMERVLKTPKKGLGEVSIDKLLEYAKKRQISLMQACFDLTGDDPFAETKIIGVKAFTILNNFTNLIRKWRENGKSSISDFIAEIVRMIEEIKYIEFLKEEDEDQIDARSANINELLNSMQGFETVDAFLEHISLISSADDAGIEGEDAVKMLTIHTAKGLEFPIVFLPGWEEGLFPSAKTLDEGGEIGVEEERRLAYVAITRARERLFLSHTKMRMIYGGFNPTRESIFVSEIKHSSAVQYRDKSIGNASSTFGINYGRNYEMSGERFRAGSFSEEIKNVKKLDLIEVGVVVKHKIFGFGKVVKRASPNLFEVIFDEDMERKTRRSDFLTFVRKSD